MQKLLHIPHSTFGIEPQYRSWFVLNDEELYREQLRMVDRYTDELFDGFHKVIFKHCRLLCDVERFLDPAQEEMTAKGMWIDYTKTSQGLPLKGNHDTEWVVENLYKPHHALMTAKVEELLQNNGECLIADCHSFASVALPYEDATKERPDICIGTDAFHTPVEIAQKALKAFSGYGYRVGLNTPFSGAFVPCKFYKQDRRVKALMIEVNRSLYMDETTGERGNNFDKVKKNIQNVLACL